LGGRKPANTRTTDSSGNRPCAGRVGGWSRVEFTRRRHN